MMSNHSTTDPNAAGDSGSNSQSISPFQSFTEGVIIPLIGIPRRKIQQSTFSCCLCVVVQVPGGRGRLVCLVLTERQNIAAAFMWMLQVRPVLPACKSTRCACEKVKWSRPLAAVPDTFTDGGSAWSQTIAAEFLGSMDDAGRENGGVTCRSLFLSLLLQHPCCSGIV